MLGHVQQNLVSGQVPHTGVRMKRDGEVGGGRGRGRDRLLSLHLIA